MIRELDVDEFTAMLKSLDSILQTDIEIRAVGGFALAWHEVRTRGLTADIDTITDDYPKEVSDAIAKVAADNDLDPWWINNDAAADDAEFLIESLGLTWESVDLDLKHISLYVADLDSLLTLKLAAVEDSALSGRTRDLDDTIRILKALGYTKESFKEKFAYLIEDKPNAFRMITGAVW